MELVHLFDVPRYRSRRPTWDDEFSRGDKKVPPHHLPEDFVVGGMLHDEEIEPREERIIRLRCCIARPGQSLAVDVTSSPGGLKAASNTLLVHSGFCKLSSSLRSSPPSPLLMLASFICTASASATQDNPNSRDGSLRDSLAFNVVWYVSVFLTTVGYTVLSYYHRDRGSFLGLGMGISSWAYMVMVFAGDVPLDVIVR